MQINIFRIFLMIGWIAIVSGMGCKQAASYERRWSREIPDVELVQMLESKSGDKRTTALEYIADMIAKKNYVLKDEVKQRCYILIQEFVEEKWSEMENEDDEGHYPSAVFQVATLINDKKFLPYFLRCLNTDEGIVAIMKQGDDSVEKMFEILELPLQNDGAKYDTIQTLTSIVTAQHRGIYLNDKFRNRIKKIIARNIEDIDYEIEANGIRKDEKGKRSNERKARVKVNALELIGLLGDGDLIPIVEKSAKNDAYYRELEESKVNYLRMTDDEQRRYSVKNPRANFTENKKVKYYEVRECAEKVLRELKKVRDE